jgi:hypothetical protein
MSAPSIASSTNSSPLQELHQHRRSEFKTMASDVQSGNMTGAQAALSALQQSLTDVQGLGGASGGQGSQQPGSLQNDFANLINSIRTGSLASVQNALGGLQTTQQPQTVHANAATGSAPSGFGQDLASLIQAVQAGNLTNAQQDLTQLQADGAKHRHHDSDSGGVASTSAATNAVTASGAGSTTGSAGSSASLSASAYASIMNLQATSSLVSALV